MNTLKLLRKAIAITALPLFLAATATTQVGCLGHAGPTEVAQGKKFASGDPTYDQFFTAVHDLQLEMGSAPTKEAKLRLELGKALGVEPEEEDEAPAAAPAKTAAAPKAEASTANGAPGATDAYSDQLKQSAISAVPGGAQYQAAKAQVEQAKATVNQFKSLFGGGGSSEPAAAAKPAAPVKKEPKPPSAALIGKALKKKADKLGVPMKLDVDRNGLAEGEGSAELRYGSEDAASEAKSLGEKIEKTAKAEIELIGRMKKAQKKLENLEKLAATLDANVDTTFRTSRGKMSDVHQNLSDATALIKLMATRAQDVDKKAQSMLVKLEDAASADIPKPGDDVKNEAVASTTTTNPAADEAKAAEEAKKEEAAAKAKADETEKKRQSELARLKKDAVEKEAEAKKAKKEAAEKEAEAKKAKRDAEREAKKGPAKTSASAKQGPTKSAMADFEP